MKIEIKVPEVGESVREAVLAEWYKRDGDPVKKGELLFLIETDKVTLEVNAEGDGVLKITVSAGETVPVGSVVGILDTQAEPAEDKEMGKKEAADKREEAPRALSAEAALSHAESPEGEQRAARKGEGAPPTPLLAPSVRRLVAQEGLDVSKIRGTGPGGRITKGDIVQHLEESRGAKVHAEGRSLESEAVEPTGQMIHEKAAKSEAVVLRDAGIKRVIALEEDSSLPEETTRRPMSPIRLRIAERLLEARRNTAMLTTFNEIDMSRVQSMRAQFKEAFRRKHGVSLGMMSFFIKAAVSALKEFPEVNAFIDGKDIVYNRHQHIGVAIGGERGLVVPVIRFAENLSFAQLELAIQDYVQKVKENRLELRDLEGGTFTISNGGIYGSLLSTPILNTPQSGILGMHKIEDRPVVLEGQITIRPMMYVALSYDHRIIDGREAVSFLKRIKECVECPERIMVEI